MNELKKGPAVLLPESGDAPLDVYLVPPKKRSYPVRWLLLWQDPSAIGVSIKEQAMNSSMTLTDYRVRDYLLADLGIGNMCYVNQAELARLLKVRKATVCESLKRLVELGILIRGPKTGRNVPFMVSPAFCFSGGLGAGVQARKAEIREKAKVIPFRTS